MSTIAKYELTQNQWNELNQFIMQSCNSEEPKQREVGYVQAHVIVMDHHVIHIQVGMIVLSSLMDLAAVDVSITLIL